MITIEKSPAHVLAVRLSGTLEESDIAMLSKAFQDKLAANDRLGLVIDMTEWSDMTAEAIAEDMKFEFGLLGKLGRFPRMAIVSDKQFVKTLMKFLDPLIPAVTVKTFGAQESQQALAFATELPAARVTSKPAITLIDTGNPKLIGFEINGLLTKDDLERVIPPLQQAFEQDAKIDLFARMTNYAGFDSSIFTQKSLFAMKLTAVNHIRRYAVVGAPGWMKNAAGMFASMLPLEIHFFDAEQEDEAWGWLKS